MNYELIAAAVYLCSVIVCAYYFIEMGLMKDKVYSTMCFIPFLNTFFAATLGLISLYWWFRNRYIEIKYYLIRKFNTWIIIQYSKIHKDIITFCVDDKNRKAVLDELERLNNET